MGGTAAWNDYRPGASGGDSSPLLRAALDWEGRRILAGAESAARVGENTIDDWQEPVRVYAGHAHAADPFERARLAVAELHRLCPAPPSLVVVGCPTGTGYVNSSALCAAELLSSGQCASIASQFGTKRSVSSAGSFDDAVTSLAALLVELAARVANDWRPGRVLIWAESFGGWTLARALELGEELLDAIDAPTSVAWVGLPGPLLATQKTRAIVERRVASNRIWSDGDQVAAHEPGDVLLVHRDDPVAHVTGVRLLVAPQRHDVPSAQGVRRFRAGWRPVATALRARREVDLETRPGGPTELRRPHDYRYAAVRVVATSAGLREPDSEDQRLVARAERWMFDELDLLGPSPERHNPWK